MTPTFITRTMLENAGCTPPEIDAVLLYELGCGYRTIARHLDLSTTTTRDLIDSAARRLANHQEAEQ